MDRSQPIRRSERSHSEPTTSASAWSRAQNVQAGELCSSAQATLHAAGPIPPIQLQLTADVDIERASLADLEVRLTALESQVKSAEGTPPPDRTVAEAVAQDMRALPVAPGIQQGWQIEQAQQQALKSVIQPLKQGVGLGKVVANFPVALVGALLQDPTLSANLASRLGGTAVILNVAQVMGDTSNLIIRKAILEHVKQQLKGISPADYTQQQLDSWKAWVAQEERLLGELSTRLKVSASTTATDLGSVAFSAAPATFGGSLLGQAVLSSVSGGLNILADSYALKVQQGVFAEQSAWAESLAQGAFRLRADEPTAEAMTANIQALFHYGYQRVVRSAETSEQIKTNLATAGFDYEAILRNPQLANLSLNSPEVERAFLQQKQAKYEQELRDKIDNLQERAKTLSLEEVNVELQKMGVITPALSRMLQEQGAVGEVGLFSPQVFQLMLQQYTIQRFYGELAQYHAAALAKLDPNTTPLAPGIRAAMRTLVQMKQEMERSIFNFSYRTRLLSFMGSLVGALVALAKLSALLGMVVLGSVALFYLGWFVLTLTAIGVLAGLIYMRLYKPNLFRLTFSSEGIKLVLFEIPLAFREWQRKRAGLKQLQVAETVHGLSVQGSHDPSLQELRKKEQELKQVVDALDEKITHLKLIIEPLRQKMLEAHWNDYVALFNTRYFPNSQSNFAANTEVLIDAIAAAIASGQLDSETKELLLRDLKISPEVFAIENLEKQKKALREAFQIFSTAGIDRMMEMARQQTFTAG